MGRRENCSKQEVHPKKAQEEFDKNKTVCASFAKKHTYVRLQI